MPRTRKPKQVKPPDDANLNTGADAPEAQEADAGGENRPSQLDQMRAALTDAPHKEELAEDFPRFRSPRRRQSRPLTWTSPWRPPPNRRPKPHPKPPCRPQRTATRSRQRRPPPPPGCRHRPIPRLLRRPRRRRGRAARARVSRWALSWSSSE